MYHIWLLCMWEYRLTFIKIILSNLREFHLQVWPPPLDVNSQIKFGNYPPIGNIFRILPFLFILEVPLKDMEETSDYMIRKVIFRMQLHLGLNRWCLEREKFLTPSRSQEHPFSFLEGHGRKHIPDFWQFLKQYCFFYHYLAGTFLANTVLASTNSSFRRQSNI